MRFQLRLDRKRHRYGFFKDIFLKNYRVNLLLFEMSLSHYLLTITFWKIYLDGKALLFEWKQGRGSTQLILSVTGVSYIEIYLGFSGA